MDFNIILLSTRHCCFNVRRKEGKGGWTIDDITWIIRVISMVVMFIPLLATWRGVFQGYESMGPTAVSEVTEQIARIVFILIGSF